MKAILYTLGIAGALLAACNNTTKTGETFANENAEAPMDSAALMQAWTDYMTPGKMHKMIASWNGTWDGEITYWMGPDTPPVKYKTVAENNMVMNGLYQVSAHTADMNGIPFEGRSTLAFNNSTKEFESSWIDNMGSGIMLVKGGWDSTTKIITMKGTMTEPMSSDNIEVKEVIKIIDDSTQILQMFDKQHGEEFKSMEIVFRRRM